MTTNNLEDQKPCRSRAGLICIRLQQIEEEAQKAFTLAAERLAVYDDDPDAWLDVDFVASLLTGANPEARPNLTLNGERVAGSLEPGAVGMVIRYEEFHPIHRQRFSVAHELGHYYLHAGQGLGTYHRCPVLSEDIEDTEDPEGIPGEPLSVVEAEADAFAGAFLLPSDKVVAAIDDYGIASEFLAQLFKVSKGTVRNRIATLELLGILPRKG